MTTEKHVSNTRSHTNFFGGALGTYEARKGGLQPKKDQKRQQSKSAELLVPTSFLCKSMQIGQNFRGTNGTCLCLVLGHTPSTAGTFRKKFRKDSGKTPETLSERFLEFPPRVRLGCPKPNNSRHLRLPERFQNSLPPSTAGDASFFRIGSGEGLSELFVMEFPAILGVFLRFRGPRMGVGSVVVGLRVLGGPRCCFQRSPEPFNFEGFGDSD